MIQVVVGDTKPDLSFRFQRDRQDITGLIASVEFRLRKPDGNVVIRPLTLQDGAFVGNFGLGDLSQGGRQYGELVVTFLDGGVQHAPEPVELYVRPEYTEAI